MLALLTLLATILSPNPPPPVSYACDGSTAIFTVNFPYDKYTDLVVTSTTSGGAVTTLVYTTDYTVSVTSSTTTASLTLNAPASSCPNTNILKINRTTQRTQPTNFAAQTTYNPALHTKVADRLEMQIQELSNLAAGTTISFGPGQLFADSPIIGDGSSGNHLRWNFGVANTWTATQTFTPGSAGAAIVATGSGANPGVRAVGSTSGSNGISATGTSTNAGVLGTGGASGADGVQGVATGNGNGVTGTGLGTGSGIYGTGGNNSGAGVTGIGGSVNGVGGSFTGTNDGTGVAATGGPFAFGADISAGGMGGIRSLGQSSPVVPFLGGVGGAQSASVFVGGTYNGGANGGVGVEAYGALTAAGVYATGGATNGVGVQGYGNGSSGIGVVGTGAGYGVAGTGDGVQGLSQGGTGVLGSSATGVGGKFSTAGPVPARGQINLNGSLGDPSAPVNGDIWTSGANLPVLRGRLNGVTYTLGPLKAGTCAIGSTCVAITMPVSGMVCTCSDNTSAAACKAIVTTTTLAITGTGTDTCTYTCMVAQ